MHILWLRISTSGNLYTKERNEDVKETAVNKKKIINILSDQQQATR